MVQIISPSPRAMQQGQLGQALGIGLGKNLALSEAESAANQAQGDPVKLAFSLARASMAAPGLERSLGQIYEQLLSKSASNQLATNTGQTGTNQVTTGEISPTGPVPSSTNVPLTAKDGIPEIEESQSQIVLPNQKNYSSNDIKNVSHQFIASMRPDLIEGTSSYGRVPTFNYQSKSTLRPEEEGQIRQNLAAKGVLPQVQEQIIQNIRNDVQARYAENLKNFGLDQERQNQINQKWNVFRQNSDTNLEPVIGKFSPTLGFGGKPKTYDDLKNKYFQYAGELPVDLTPEQMHAQASAMLKNDINRIDALDSLPSLPFVRDPKDIENTIKDHREAYRDLYKEGFYESLKENAVANDMGLEELHQTLWGEQTNKSILNSVGSLQAPKFYLKDEKLFAGPGAPPKVNQVLNPKYPEMREKYVNDLSKTLKNIGETDDLILLRAQAINSGAKERDFNDALDLALKNGLKLSPFQSTQLQEVRIPRTRPIWEIMNPSAWSNWINNLRGKR